MASTDRIDGYAAALIQVARAEGSLDTVEDELFRFGRTLAGSDELRNALTDQAIPAARRQSIVESLLGGKAHPTTTNLVSFVVGAGRARDLPAIIDSLVSKAAAEKSKVVAEVRTAYAISDDQRERLAAALANATGTPVEVKVIIDASVIGGVVAQVGDTVIDGSVRRRLDQLKSLL
jgi:F-type H+-transporting ATPase subunit delta